MPPRRPLALPLALLALAALAAAAPPADFCRAPPAPAAPHYAYKDVPAQNCGACRPKARCVRKCCAVGYRMARGQCRRAPGALVVAAHDDRRFVRNVSVPGERRGFLAGVVACDFFALRNGDGADWWLYQADGRLLTSVYGLIDSNEFCLDYLEGGEVAAFVCYASEGGDGGSKEAFVIGMIISMPFLLATFIVYALLPERNLHMKALMNYVICLMLSYLFLVFNQLDNSTLSFGTCLFVGYSTLFFFMASLYWMNTICFDIWLTFSGIRSRINRKEAEKRRYWYYSAYSWGMSLLHIIFVYVMDVVITDSKYKPGIDESQCYLKKGLPELFYCYGPMSIILFINVLCFGVTAKKIWFIRKETAVLRKDENAKHSHEENDKQAYNLYLRLLFAMGINWTMEIISWAVLISNPDAPVAIWYLTDFCNALYGVFIFFLFVFKRSIWKLLKKRYYSFAGRPLMAHSMTNRQEARTTNYSTTVSALSTSET